MRVYKQANDEIRGTLIINGVIVAIEWPKGSVRQWPGSDTRIPMSVAYGYVSRTDSEDGEEIDVYVGDNLDSRLVVELEQLKDGEHDEYKYMLGYNSVDEAIASYEEHMDFNKVGEVKEMTWEEFEQLLPVNSHTFGDARMEAKERQSKESRMIHIDDLVRVAGPNNRDYIGRVKCVIAGTLAKIQLVAGEVTCKLEDLKLIPVKFANDEQEEIYLEKRIERLKQDGKNSEDELDEMAIEQGIEEAEREIRKVQEKQAFDPSFFGGMKVKKADDGPSDADCQAMAWNMFGGNWNGLSSEQMDEIHEKLGFPVTAAQSKSDQEKEMSKGNEDTLRSPGSLDTSEHASDLLEREYRKQGFPGEGTESNVELSNEKLPKKKADANITMGTPPKDMEGMEHISAHTELTEGDMVIVEGHNGNGIIQKKISSPGVESTGEGASDAFEVLLIGEDGQPQQVVVYSPEQLEFAGSNVNEHTANDDDMKCTICGGPAVEGEVYCDRHIDRSKTAQVQVTENWNPDGSISRTIKFDEVNPQEAEALMSLINHAPAKEEENVFEETPQEGEQPVESKQNFTEQASVRKRAMQSPADQGIDEGHSKSKGDYEGRSEAQGDQENPPFEGPAMPGQLMAMKKKGGPSEIADPEVAKKAIQYGYSGFFALRSREDCNAILDNARGDGQAMQMAMQLIQNRNAYDKAAKELGKTASVEKIAGTITCRICGATPSANDDDIAEDEGWTVAPYGAALEDSYCPKHKNRAPKHGSKIAEVEDMNEYILMVKKLLEDGNSFSGISNELRHEGLTEEQIKDVFAIVAKQGSKKEASAFSKGDIVESNSDLKQTGWKNTVPAHTKGKVLDIETQYTAFGGFTDYHVSWDNGEDNWVGNGHLLLHKVGSKKVIAVLGTCDCCDTTNIEVHSLGGDKYCADCYPAMEKNYKAGDVLKTAETRVYQCVDCHERVRVYPDQENKPCPYCNGVLVKTSNRKSAGEGKEGFDIPESKDKKEKELDEMYEEASY